MMGLLIEKNDCLSKDRQSKLFLITSELPQQQLLQQR